MSETSRYNSFADLNDLTDQAETTEQVEQNGATKSIMDILDKLIADYSQADFGSPRMITKLDQIKVILGTKHQSDKSLPIDITLNNEDELYLTNIVAGEDYQSKSSQEIADIILEFYKSKQ